jgi:hypothetical protein
MGLLAHQGHEGAQRGADSQSAAPRLVSASGEHRHKCRCSTQECAATVRLQRSRSILGSGLAALGIRCRARSVTGYRRQERAHSIPNDLHTDANQ